MTSSDKSSLNRMNRRIEGIRWIVEIKVKTNWSVVMHLVRIWHLIRMKVSEVMMD